MQRVFRYLFLVTLLAGQYGCGQKGAKLQKSVVPPDKTLFETGQEYLEKSQYIKARLAFQTLINTYPDSELTAESYLAVGDSFYREAGTENYLQAEDQYKNFIIFFPTHPKAADAQMKIISLNMRMMRAPDRDPTYAYKAQDAIKKMLEQFPNSEFIPAAQDLLTEVQENLAQKDFLVGKFYADKGNHRAAKSRFKEIIDSYPDYSGKDETYYMMAQSLEKTESSDEAAIYYGRLAQGFPFSKRFDEAKARLDAMGKPVPPVDTVLAAQNEAKQKPSEGFSPLRPIVDFGKALGFIGPPDPYVRAKKMVEAQSTATAQAAALASEAGKSGDDILITTTLTKSATGETKEKTVLGANAKENGPAAATDGDKAKASKKKKKNENSNKKPKKGDAKKAQIKSP